MSNDFVFHTKIEELISKKLKQYEVEKIKKALMAGELEDAHILYKYSSLNESEFEEIEIEVLIESRSEMTDWTSGEDLRKKAIAFLKERENKKDQQ